MKIIARGNAAIPMAIETATAALSAGIRIITIECKQEEQDVVIFPSAAAFCPVDECKECTANVCPFSRQSGNEIEALQAEYSEAEARLLDIGNRLRGKIIHG